MPNIEVRLAAKVTVPITDAEWDAASYSERTLLIQTALRNQNWKTKLAGAGVSVWVDSFTTDATR